MTRDEIERTVKAYLLQAISNPGIDLETNKLDFKSEWYNLKDEKGKNEFLKDATGIVNSYGGADGFIVIGFNCKDNSFVNSPFTQSGLKDKTELIGIIASKVDRPFNLDEIPIQYNGKILSVVHIPPSLDKPHVIRRYVSDKGAEYENEVFVRHGSGAKRATKHDLDLMYAEKRSIVIDKRIDASINLILHTHRFQEFESVPISFKTHIFLHNFGSRTIAFSKLILTIQVNGFENGESRVLRFSCRFDEGLMELAPDRFSLVHVTLMSEGLNLNREQRSLLVAYLSNLRRDPDKVIYQSLMVELVSGETLLANLNVIR
jgi:hypothetical protein